MSLDQRLKDEIKAAMRSRDKARLEALRALRGDVLKEEKSGNDTVVDDALVQKFAKSQIKQRQDAIDAFRTAGRDELAAPEEAIIAIMQEFLPQAISADALAKLIDEAVAGIEAPTAKDMGPTIGKVRGQVAALGLDVDGRELAAAVKAKLNS